MSARPGHDLSELIKWLARDEWRPHVDAVMAQHFTPAMDAFGLTFEAIGEALGGTWDRVLWGCAFEDALTRRFGPDDANPVEAYLKREGERRHPRLHGRAAKLGHEPLRSEQHRARAIPARSRPGPWR